MTKACVAKKTGVSKSNSSHNKKKDVKKAKKCGTPNHPKRKCGTPAPGPKLCPYAGAQPKPHWNVNTINYQTISYEEYTEISASYTYWIQHSQTQEEYNHYEEEYKFIHDHYAEYHHTEELYAIPVIEEWEIKGGNHGNHEHHHEEHAEPQVIGGGHQVVDNGIVCFPANSDAAKKLLASGVVGESVEEADFEVHCHDWIKKISHCESSEEYTTYVHQYEEYVHKYEVTHKGCTYPKVPAFKGKNGQNAATGTH